MSNSVKFQSGTCYTYQDLKYYAINGCICLHDEEDGSFIVLTCREFLERAKALSEEVKRLAVMMTENSRPFLAEERKKLQDQVDNMIFCIQEARHQGDHDDPQVAAWFRRHRPWARGRAKTNSREADFQTKLPGKLPRGKFTGRTCGPGVSVPQVAAATARIPGHTSRPSGLVIPNDIL
jgi:hypothetical protein